MNKTLVAYFSASGETAKLAKTIAEAVTGDLYEIVPKQTYTDADLNWNDKHSRSSVEMNDTAFRPAIAGMMEQMDEYDTVYVGFPIWWYVAPTIINTFLESYDFSGKTVIPFATSGGSGMGKTVDVLKSICPAARFLPGKRLNSGASSGEVSSWVNSLGL